MSVRPLPRSFTSQCVSFAFCRSSLVLPATIQWVRCCILGMVGYLQPTRLVREKKKISGETGWHVSFFVEDTFDVTREREEVKI